MLYAVYILILGAALVITQRFPTKQRGTGHIEELDLIFQKEESK